MVDQLLMPTSSPLPGKKDIEDRTTFIISAARTSAAVILPYFRSPLTIDHKEGLGRFDPVTEADRAGEQVIRKMIEATYPDDAIFGEEFGEKAGTSPYCWVLDPIDGTRSFITGIPLWGTLIGLTYEGQAIIGAMNQPYIGELFLGSPDGSFLLRNENKTRLKTRQCTEIGNALMGSTAPEIFTEIEDISAFERVKNAVKMTRFGGDCYLYSMVAAGQLDLVVETNLNSYDIAALVPVVENAGGIITTWEGGPASDGGRIVAAGCRQLHDAALEVLRR